MMKIDRFDFMQRALLSRKLQGLVIGESVWVDVRKAASFHGVYNPDSLVSVCLKRLDHNQFTVSYMQYRSSLIDYEVKDSLKFGKGGDTYVSSAKLADAANSLVQFVQNFELSHQLIEKSKKERIEVVIVPELPMFPMLPATVEVMPELLPALAAV